jgi:hypothetical protein
MTDFRVIRMNTGESFLCIVESETDDTINVLFPLSIRTQQVPIAKNILREIHSTTVFCPFSDDKHFTFWKHELTYIKPMSEHAVPYYIDMLNRHEEVDALKAYNLEELVAPEENQQDEFKQDIQTRVENLINKMEEIEEETSVSDAHILTPPNKTVH